MRAWQSKGSFRIVDKDSPMSNAARIWQMVVFALCAVGLLAIAEAAWAT